MTLKVTKTDVWAAEIDDKPGGLAMTLRALADCGADLDGVMARRESATPGKGVVFVTPLRGKEQLARADEAGFHSVHRIPTLKIEGKDRPGVGSEISKTIGSAEISIRGLSATTVGRKFVCFIGFDNVKDMENAQQALESLTKKTWTVWTRHQPGKKASKSKPTVAA